MIILKMLRKERTEYGKKIRKAYENHEIYEKRSNMSTFVPRADDICNTITTVLKDCTLLEIDMYVGIKQATKLGYEKCVLGGGGGPIISHKRN